MDKYGSRKFCYNHSNQLPCEECRHEAEISFAQAQHLQSIKKQQDKFKLMDRTNCPKTSRMGA